MKLMFLLYWNMMFSDYVYKFICFWSLCCNHKLTALVFGYFANMVYIKTTIFTEQLATFCKFIEVKVVMVNNFWDCVHKFTIKLKIKIFITSLWIHIIIICCEIEWKQCTVSNWKQNVPTNHFCSLWYHSLFLCFIACKAKDYHFYFRAQ